MIHSENSDELIRMVRAIGGWEGLDDELQYEQVDHVARQLAQVLDQRDYVVYQLIRRYLILLDYNASPNLGDCFARLLLWPKEFQQEQFDYILARKEELLKGIASATMRERINMKDAARIHIDVIKQYLKVMPYRANDLLALMYEVNYTTRICSSLVALEYEPLYDVITDMVNPDRSDLERIACRDTCDHLKLEFSAAAKAVEVVGSNDAKSTVNRFMRTRKAALDNFPTTLPAPTVITAIATELSAVATTIADLRKAIVNLPDVLAGAITLPSLLNSDGDDKARFLISELHSQGCLARTSSKVKIKLLEALLDGGTDDDDEIAINKVMQAAQDYDKAELYQLADAATWESLSYCLDGDEHDELTNILHDMFS